MHSATWGEVVRVFGHNAHRRRLLSGLHEALVQLKIAGCGRAYLDGSFVTSKSHPSDYDACWETRGVDPQYLDPVLLDLRPPRVAQKARYYGEVFPASVSVCGLTMFQFFQFDKETNDAKGIISIDLNELEIASSTSGPTKNKGDPLP